MLQTIKEGIQNLPDIDFAEHFQEYVKAQQDEIIKHDIQNASQLFTKIEDISHVIKGLNILTEGLNKL